MYTHWQLLGKKTTAREEKGIGTKEDRGQDVTEDYHGKELNICCNRELQKKLQKMSIDQPRIGRSALSAITWSM